MKIFNDEKYKIKLIISDVRKIQTIKEFMDYYSRTMEFILSITPYKAMKIYKVMHQKFQELRNIER